MRTWVLFLLLPAAAHAADLWDALHKADAVVVAHVESIDGSFAVLRRTQVLKGDAPERFTVPKDDSGGTCFSTQVFHPSDDVIAVVDTAATARKRMQLLFPAEHRNDPDTVAMLDAAERRQTFALAGPVLTVATGELSRAVALVEAGLTAKQPTDAWFASLLRLRTTWWEGARWFDTHAPTPEVRAEGARMLRANQVSMVQLRRVLPWVATIDDVALTRVAMDVVRRSDLERWPAQWLEETVTLLAKRLDPKAADPVIPEGHEGWDAETRARAKARFAALEAQLKP